MRKDAGSNAEVNILEKGLNNFITLNALDGREAIDLAKILAAMKSGRDLSAEERETANRILKKIRTILGAKSSM